MEVSVNCPKCGLGNVIPEGGRFTKENLTPRGATGTRPCVGCGVVFDWTGDQLIVKVEPIKVEAIKEESPKFVTGKKKVDVE